MQPTKLLYTQRNFSGGMNLVAQDTELAPNQYREAINVRSRFGALEPIVTPTIISTGLPAEIAITQGLYAFGSLLVFFFDGLAYYKTATSNTWVQIAGFSMSDTAERIYCCAVPRASLIYNRKNASGSLPSAGVTLDSVTTTPNPVCLVVQDGVNQPFLIFTDGTCRVSKNYSQWLTTDREYVPIGLQMVYFNGILFVVSPDKTKIYRSVTGRPLDFVVAISDAGLAVANAENTSFAVDSNEINLLAQLNTDSLIAITAYNAYAIQLNTDSLLYGEPTFNQTFLFTAGVTNQFSFADILGDFAFIDKEGLKSFNGVIQLKFEGNNSVFSQSVAKLFNQVIQDKPCVGSFDNYTFFAVKTTLGASSIIVYDNINKVFPSVDILAIGQLKQFAATYTSSVQKFYVMTENHVYELYSLTATTFKVGTVFLRSLDSFNTDQGSVPEVSEVKSREVRLFFEDCEDGGTVRLTELVDNEVQTTSAGDNKYYDRDIAAYQESGIYYPVIGPAIGIIKKYTSNISIPIKSIAGHKLSHVLTWTGGAKLQALQVAADSDSSGSNRQQASRIYA